MKAILLTLLLGGLLVFCSLDHVGFSNATITLLIENQFKFRFILSLFYFILFSTYFKEQAKFKNNMALYTMCIQFLVLFLLFIIRLKSTEIESMRSELFLLGFFLLLSFVTLVLYFKRKTHLEKLEEN